VFLHSKLASVGTSCYLLAVVLADFYPLIHYASPEYPVFLLVRPWINYLPGAIPLLIGLALCALLNALIIYFVLAMLDLAVESLRRRP